MVRELLRISLLLAGATVGLGAGDAPAVAQTYAPKAFPTQAGPPTAPRANVPLMTPPQYGPYGLAPTSPAQRLDRAQNSVQAQSCASLGGAAADRCYSDLRAKITADELRQRSIDSSLPRDKEK